MTHCAEPEIVSDTNNQTEQTLPLDGWHRALGARMVPFAGYSMPIQYEGIMAEHLWVRSHAGLFDVSHMGQVMITGPDADIALEALVPGDIAGLGEGRLRYSLLLNAGGGIMDDLMITRTPTGLYLVVNGAVKHADIAHLTASLPASLELNHLEDRALLALQGPEAVDALASIIPVVRDLVFMQANMFLWGEEPLWISRSGYTGEDGFEISVPAAHAERLASQLNALDMVKPIGLGARDSLRLEAGLPLYGHDLDETTSPVEGGLTFAIAKRRRADAGFPGAERILAELADGPARLRVGLSVEGRQPVREGAEIFAGSSPVGTITSGGFAPSVGAPVAMGYVTAGSAAPGTALEAEVRGKRIPLTVATLPFVPHRYVRKGAAK
ncbi:MAG: glycine cleavage system aminomethyltransferase GcvT [Blastomonas sp.]